MHPQEHGFQKTAVFPRGAEPRSEAHEISPPALQDTQLITTVAHNFALEPSPQAIDTIQASSPLPLDYNPFYSPPQR